MRAMIVLFSIGVASCGTPEGQSREQTSDEVLTTTNLIQSGDGRACSQEEVRAIVIDKVKPGDADRGVLDLSDFKRAQDFMSYNIDTVAVSGIDKSIHSVSCDANVVVHMDQQDDMIFPVKYVLRPSVEDPSSFVLNVHTDQASNYAREMAQLKAAELAQARLDQRREKMGSSVDNDESLINMQNEEQEPSVMPANEAESNGED